MRFAYRYRLYPTRAQAQFLDRELKEACSLYNAANQERDDAWKTCRKSINYYDQANQLKAMRTDGCLTLSNFSCCQDVRRRVDKTYSITESDALLSLGFIEIGFFDHTGRLAPSPESEQSLERSIE